MNFGNSVLNKGKSAIPPLFNGTEVSSWRIYDNAGLHESYLKARIFIKKKQAPFKRLEEAFV